MGDAVWDDERQHFCNSRNKSKFPKVEYVTNTRRSVLLTRRNCLQMRRIAVNRWITPVVCVLLLFEISLPGVIASKPFVSK
jgi:hypothetical protein